MTEFKTKAQLIETLELRLKEALAERQDSPKAELEKRVALDEGAKAACGCSHSMNTHNHTFFSVTDGISPPEDMVDATAKRGFGGIGISDHGTMGGVFRSADAAKKWTTATYKDDRGQYSVVYLSLSTSDKKKIAQQLGRAELFYFNGQKVNPAAIDKAYVSANSELYLSFDQDSPKEKCYLLQPALVANPAPFKAVSGNELYVCWKEEKHKRYNHITVYAIGQKGHRALVLLTSLGATPSRRYTGRGFTRPRVFMEDLELAINESEGELVVTSGCPLSISSEAIKSGDMDRARQFFSWCKQRLGRFRFFAELHLCDVSLDFNRLHVAAEDKFYSSVYNVPVSRFRHSNEASAQAYANKFFKDLRSSVLAPALSVETVASGFAAARPLHVDETTNTVKAQKLGTNIHVDNVLGSELKISAPITNSRLATETAKLLADSYKVYEDTKQMEEDQRAEAIKKTLGLDEESLIVLDLCAHVIESFQSINLDSPAYAKHWSFFVVASLLRYVIVTVHNNESANNVNPLSIAKSILSIPARYGLSTEENVAFLEGVRQDRMFLLDSIDDDSSEAVMLPAARAIVDLLAINSFETQPLQDLAPRGSTEDDNENEWVINPEGNWMNTVNKGLVEIAKEFDVPLLMATDSHMAYPDLKPVQDAIIKRGQRRAWHMPRAYAVPRSDIFGLLEDVGHDYQTELGYLEPTGNCAHNMLDQGYLESDDIIEAIGGTAVLLSEASSAAEFSWQPNVPKIDYTKHRLYEKAKQLLESGELREMLPLPTSPIRIGTKDISFQDSSIIMPTALMTALFLDAIDTKMIPSDDAYWLRFFEELHLQQEVPGLKLCDFFLVLSYAIDKWREAGISVGPGRGSSGGMLSAMVCGITYADPIVNNLSMSRWLNAGRKAKGTLPDIDVDVSDRNHAIEILADIAQDSMAASIAERPLSPLEVQLHDEIYYSKVSLSAKESSLSHRREIVGDLAEEAKHLKIPRKKIEAIETAVWQTPLFRVGTHQSLKGKAAVKEAVRIADNTPFDELPPFAEPPMAWRNEHSARLYGMDFDAIARKYEEETFGYLKKSELIAKRRVRKGDRLTKAMEQSSGLSRLYKNEYDFFHGAVYGIVPAYWDESFPPPAGSEEAAQYFDANPSVKELVLKMLNIYKAPGVHAGGVCFGREALERIPLRSDGYGFVAQCDMGHIEDLGILKFDTLGLETLRHVSETLKLILNEHSYEQLSSWIEPETYELVKAGASTDYLWRNIPKSTNKAIVALTDSRVGTFQVDTPVFQRGLAKLTAQKLKNYVFQKAGDDESSNVLVEIVDALLALFRPGPMAMNAHTKFIDRLMGNEPVSYLDPWLEKYLQPTLGLLVYQEQVMSIYKDATGADDEETDDVRRAMGKKDISKLENLRAKPRFIDGLKSQGVKQDQAEKIWEMVIPFAEYGFNKAHSHHYAIVTSLTLFLKANYPKYLFRVIMGLSDQKDASRFLEEIEQDTNYPCILNSDERVWRVVDDRYFPGLSTVVDLTQIEMQRILATQKELKEKLISAPTPFEFFSIFGRMTVSLARKTASSGLLRSLGGREEITKGYEKAVLEVIKPKESAIKKLRKLSDIDSDDGISDVEKKSLHELADLVIKASPNKKSKKTAVQRPLKLTKDDLAVLSELDTNLLRHLDTEALANEADQDGILTLDSAVKLVETSKARGAYAKHLAKTINTLRSEGKGKSTRPVLSVSALKSKKVGSKPLTPKDTYDTVAVVKNIANAKKYNSNESEYRITMIADGTELNAKFSRSLLDDPDRLNDIIKILKDGKMSKIFMFKIFYGEFKKEGKIIGYYKIESASPVSDEVV